MLDDFAATVNDAAAITRLTAVLDVLKTFWGEGAHPSLTGALRWSDES